MYGSVDVTVKNCTFAGPADGESALKESKNIDVTDCSFSLRYPFWHVKNFTVFNCKMDSLTRACLWYCKNGAITKSELCGIKALRECKNIALSFLKINSEEFGWKCKNIAITDSQITSQYFMFESSKIIISNIKMDGKYSFQYVKNLTVDNSHLNTKDAFWHSKNVTVKNSTVKGEYLGWYSENLTLINCKIIGTQPLCYCKNLKLINCTMEDCDLAFEYSSVKADVKGHITSVKNPKSGKIIADSIGEIIKDGSVKKCICKIKDRQC